jgi:hypothetical protein
MALPIPTMAIEISHFLIKTGRRKIPPMLGHFRLEPGREQFRSILLQTCFFVARF